MRLSVIIVNYNVRVFLENALVSVKKALAGIDGEVIVVDNASDDGSVEMLRQKFPDIVLIVNEKNVGFAAANNIAMARARGEFFLLLNPDTVVQEDTFRTMATFFQEHDDVGLAGCRILNPDGSLQLACRRSFPTPWVALTKIIGLSSLFPRSPLFGKYNLAYLDPDASYEVDAISGSFMFLRRTIFEEVGGLDEQFFMYGEDLDWCYRIKSAGWKVFYVHATQIIHYKGQSARRSDINEVKLFYRAMRVFTKKHFKRGRVLDLVLRLGIAGREWVASMVAIAKPMRAALLDWLFIDASLLFGEVLWFHEVFRFPAYAYPVTMTVPALITIAAMYTLGVYTTRKHAFTRVAGSVVVGYVILAAVTFFFKQYGFSRLVLLISGCVTIIALPGWRLVARVVLTSPEHRRKSLFGRRTLIVGTQLSGQEVLRKLRTRIDDGYDIVGFIDMNRLRVGEKISGVEILGSIDNIGKVIEEQKASEVIFSTDTLSYGDILSVISRSRSRAVNFRLVPSSMEVIIGKTHIDELDDIPFVEIEYNIDRAMNRFLKRIFDIAGSAAVLFCVYPWVILKLKRSGNVGELGRNILLVPDVFRGTRSFVGPPEFSLHQHTNGATPVPIPVYWGKPGLTGLAQLNDRDDLSKEEVEKYNLYYAKNQSLLLDVEILLKSVTTALKS